MHAHKHDLITSETAACTRFNNTSTKQTDGQCTRRVHTAQRVHSLAQGLGGQRRRGTARTQSHTRKFMQIGSETGSAARGGTEGLRFTLDGVYILVAEYSNKRLSKFRVSDGAFVDFYCAGQVSCHHKDVEIVPSGEVIVADWGTHSVFVFSTDGRTLLRTWGTEGTTDGQFKRPTALALVGNKLFVLDWNSARVQVFE